MYYLETGYDKHTRLRNAVLLALAVHAALILSISFDASNATAAHPRLRSPSPAGPAQRPEDARHVAQANQEGSGDEAEINQVTSRNNACQQCPGLHSRPAQRQQPSKQRAADVPPPPCRASGDTGPGTSRSSRNQLEGISPEVDRLSQELASLQAELDEQTRPMPTSPGCGA